MQHGSLRCIAEQGVIFFLKTHLCLRAEAEFRPVGLGYPGGKIHPFAVVSAFWMFSCHVAATDYSSSDTNPTKCTAAAHESRSLPALVSVRQVKRCYGGTSSRLQQEIRV